MASPNEVVLSSVEDGIARIRFNRPNALNAIDEALARGFLEACEEVAKRSDARVVILSAAGRAFMAGGDVRKMREAGANAGPLVDTILGYINPAVLLLADLDKPVLASLNGAVAGAGVGIALAADIAIAADDLQLNLAYARIGATPDAGATWMLPRLVGLRRALEMALLTETYDAAEALRLGLVNKVVPSAALEAETDALARELASGPTLAHARAKRLMRGALDATFAQQLEAERATFKENTRAGDYQEGVAAFVEKRAPRFSGT